jgi:hypothetical protein
MISMLKSRNATFHRFGTVVGAVGEQMLEPGAVLACVVEDHESAGALEMSAAVRLSIRRRGGIDSDVALASS